MSAGTIEGTFKNIKRFGDIVHIIFKYELQDYIQGLELPESVKKTASLIPKGEKKYRDLSYGKRVRLALEELGPTYIKFGQILSTRPELLSKEMASELGNLQDHVEPEDFEVMQKVLEQELEGTLGSLFKYVNKKPFGSASLGQVHKATLKDGTPVAIKIQRPDIEERIEEDLEILGYLAQHIEDHVEELKYHRPTKIFNEFRELLQKELDYEKESANIRTFQKMFEDDQGIYIMQVFPEYSTKKVLTMELVEGIRVRDLIREPENYSVDASLLVDRGVNAILKQALEEGFFHADPHPGNLIVLEDNVISFIDFGMVGRIDTDRRAIFIEILEALSKKDLKQMSLLLVRVAEDYDVDYDKVAFEKELAEIVDFHLNKPIKDVSLGDCLVQVTTLMTEHRMYLPSDFSMMIKVISMMETMGKKLDPEMLISDKTAAFVKKSKFKKYNPKKVGKELVEIYADYYELFKAMPDRIRESLSQFQDGELKLVVHHRPSDDFQDFVNRSVNRVVHALILAAMLVGSSIMVQSGTPPKIYNIPAIGLIGFLIAGFMSLRLLYAIIKDAKVSYEKENKKK
jgi:ubiquinone biosynthesis protein